MQDPSIYTEIKPQFSEQEHLNCPRCDSENTKFCYYNNYNLSQPRHYCKSCRRYWTKGGSLRNIPVGGASRKNTKRSSSSSSSSAIKRSSTTSSSSANYSSSSSKSKPKPKPEPFGIPSLPAFDHSSSTRMLDVTGPFNSLMASTGPQFGNFLEALNMNGPNLQLDEFSRNPNSNSGSGSGSGSDVAPEILGVQNGWSGNNGWADLAIYTPGSNLQ